MIDFICSVPEEEIAKALAAVMYDELDMCGGVSRVDHNGSYKWDLCDNTNNFFLHPMGRDRYRWCQRYNIPSRDARVRNVLKRLGAEVVDG